MMINSETKVCAVIGNPIAHSLSPILHNTAFQETGLNYLYVAFKVEDLKGAMEGVRALGIHGLSVTIPHKIRIIDYLDELDPLAQEIGSVNTVLNINGKLRGYNTDGPGALKALKDKGVEFSGAKVLIIGSGGAARAIAFSLVREKNLAGLTIMGILEDQIKELGEDIKTKAGYRIDGGLIDKERLREVIQESDILINCSPVGMYPQVEESPVEKSFLKEDLTVFDVVYNPVKTRLLRDAEEMGCKVVSGLEMFLNQAVMQFKLFTAVEPPVESMRRVLLQKLGG